MLCKDASERISTHDALNHEWFEDEQAGNLTNLTADLFGKNEKSNFTSNLSEYKKANKLNKAIKMFNHKVFRNNKDVTRMRDLFLSADRNSNGTLEKNEMREVLLTLYNDIKEEEADDMFDMLDVNQDGNIN